VIGKSWTILVGLSILAGVSGCAQENAARSPSSASRPQSEEAESEPPTDDDAPDDMHKVGEMSAPGDNEPGSVEPDGAKAVTAGEPSGGSMEVQPPSPIQQAELPLEPRGGAGPQSAVKVRRPGVTTDRRGYSPERVFYATNRTPAVASALAVDPDLYFGDDIGDLSLGTCEVSIPYKRQPGALPEPSILRLEFSQDPAKHVVLMEIEQLPHAAFWKQLRAKVEASPEKQLMLFVHGYCATFRDAARRTAQLSYDLNYQGPAMFFSWPAGSDSEKFDERPNYLKDLRRAQESDEDLITVIQDLGRYSGAKSIHLVAHSMGNFLLTEALKTIDDRLPVDQPRRQLFDQVVMAAPDINAKEFVKRTGLRLKPFSRRVTVYASTEDKALWLSKKVNGYEPLGFLNEFSQGGARSALYDLVDASQFTTGWFDSGHIYYGDMPEVLHDLGFIFRGIQAASLQRGLAETPPMYRLSKRAQ
jgi:esterase/lipase superfamily enzyme